MTKNVVILDENNNEIGKTYPKRAKGLIKSGRAESVRDGVIRMTAQPSAPHERTEASMENKKITVDTVIKKIDELLNDKEHLAKAYEVIEKADKEWKAAHIMSIVAEREETIRRALDFYEDVYEGLVPEEEEESSEEEASEEASEE